MTEKNNLKIGVVGSGSWATAMIKMLSDNSLPKELLWWVRKEKDRENILKFKHNPSYLSAVEIKMRGNQISTRAKDVVSASDIVVLNTPAAYLLDALVDVKSADLKGKIIVSAIKGIVPNHELTVADYLMQEYQVSLEKIVVIGGPCHAEEISQERLSYLTFGSVDKENAAKVAKLYANHYIKTILSDDTMGIEYGAVLKNIFALAGGICHGLGYGDNFQAVLVANAIHEMEVFVDALAPLQRDIKASAYLGDLLVTAYSQYSRNRTFGHMIGKGYSVQSAQLEMSMVAEGYYASKCIQTLIRKHELEMPICNMVFEVLYNKQSVTKEVAKLAEKLI